jgi:hypothetical protein
MQINSLFHLHNLKQAYTPFSEPRAIDNRINFLTWQNPCYDFDFGGANDDKLE